MRPRFFALMTSVVVTFAVAGCAGPTISSDDVSALCSATGAAMSAVDDALLEASARQGEWSPAIDAVGEVVDEARDTGYPGAIELAEDWQASVVAASQAEDRGAAFSLLIDSQGNIGLLFMCDKAGASVPGVAPVASGDPDSGVPGWAGAAAWVVLAVVAVATVVVRRRREESALLHGALLGMLLGALIVLIATVAVAGWLLADGLFFGLPLSPLDSALLVLADPGTPVWALLLGGTVGSICGAGVQLMRHRSRRGSRA